jgi:hypothetical protein
MRKNAVTVSQLKQADNESFQPDAFIDKKLGSPRPPSLNPKHEVSGYKSQPVGSRYVLWRRFSLRDPRDVHKCLGGGLNLHQAPLEVAALRVCEVLGLVIVGAVFTLVATVDEELLTALFNLYRPLLYTTISRV